MLDAWRGQLGERLRQLSALSVGQAMMGLWQLATEQASQAIAGRFAEERAALEAACGALATERQTWNARLEAAETDRARTQAAKDLAEHACATLDAQLQDSHAFGRISLSSGTGCRRCVTIKPMILRFFGANLQASVDVCQRANKTRGLHSWS
jgi:hypothetical protein